MKKSNLKIAAFFLSLLLHLMVVLFMANFFHSFQIKQHNKPYFVDVIELPKNNNQEKIKEKHKIAANINKKGVGKHFSKKEKIPMRLKKKGLSLKRKSVIIHKGKKITDKNIVKIKGGLFNTKANISRKGSSNLFSFDKTYEYQYKNSKDEATVSIGTQSIKYASYMQHIKDMIQNTWVYPEDAKENNQQVGLLIIFTINSDGSVSRVRLLRSSGYGLLDQAAINAVKEASPFPKLPKRFHIKRLNVYATFLYKLSFYYVE